MNRVQLFQTPDRTDKGPSRILCLSRSLTSPAGLYREVALETGEQRV